jgi:glycosyltransferase involved in cell wall biosynthesis
MLLNISSKKKNSLIVIILNYNHGKYLKKNINSFLSQTYLPDKILIIDDGSTDNSRSFIKKIKNKSKIISTKIFKKNLGPIARLNQSLKYIKHSHFIFFGADDFLIDVKALEMAMEAFNKYPKAGIASSLIVNADKSSLIVKKVKTPIVSNKTIFFNKEEVVNIFKKYGWWINSHPLIIRSEAFFNEKMKFINLGRYMDILVFYKLAFKYGSIFIPRYTGAYRLVKNQYGQKKVHSMIDNINFNQFILELKKIKILRKDKDFFKKVLYIRKMTTFNSLFLRFFYLLFLNPKFLFFYYWSRLPKF